MTIGQLARRVGVNLETVRYYERIGILAAPRRTTGGYRIYAPADEKALLAICRGRDLGFSLAEIRTILRSGEPEEVRCPRTREIAIRHLERLRIRIADLKRTEDLLARAVALCSVNSDRGCPVVDLLTRPSSQPESKSLDCEA
jgi:MerR family mercuric resistance operon transcriptional regulator